LETIKVASPDVGSCASGLIISRQTPQDQSIYHKNLMPVVYVTGE